MNEFNPFKLTLKEINTLKGAHSMVRAKIT